LPFARVAEASRDNVKAALDSGALGLILPMIENTAQLEQALAWAHYPPKGCRGVGYCRANAYGAKFSEYLTESENIFMVAQIEHIKAVDSLEAILALPGLDAIMVGPYDLSGSMGIIGQLDHPDVTAAMNRIAALAKHAGVPMGTHVVMPDPAELSARVREGYLFLAYGIDAVFLRGASSCPEY
jgi:2-dehydro-3-deoxyglucarate aldolase